MVWDARTDYDDPLMGQEKPAQVFGGYRIERSFGAGFGVFLARPMASPESSLVVLKRRPSLGLKVDRVPFLTIPEVVEVRDAGRVSDWLYVAMERVPGRDLFSVWNRCAEKQVSIPPDVAVAVMMGVLAGLRNAHREGVAHGNLWAGKVILTPMGRVILTEFMLNRALIGGLIGANPRLTSFRAGYGPRSPSGTPEAGDILQAGRLLWELLTGQPIASDASGRLGEAPAAGPGADRPSLHNPEVPPSLDDVAVRALSTDPGAAFRSAQDFQTALGGAAGLTSSRELIATFLRKVYEESELTGMPVVAPSSAPDGQIGAAPGGTKVLPAARRSDPIPIRAAQQQAPKPFPPAPAAPTAARATRSRSPGHVAMVVGAIAVLVAGGGLVYRWQTQGEAERAPPHAEERVEPARAPKVTEPPPAETRPTPEADPAVIPGADLPHEVAAQAKKPVEPTQATDSSEAPSPHRIARDAHERPEKHARPHDAATGSSFTDQGQAAFDHGDFDGALALARRAIRAREGAAAYILMGDAEIKVGNEKAAGRAYRAALRLDPRSEGAKIGLEAASKSR